MKFTKFGKALLMSALSTGVLLSVTSCVQSYSVGFLYVTGTVTSESDGNGIISGFKIDHNTGKLSSVHGLPVSSGGANPVRAVLFNNRFIYVLNRGANESGGSDCTTADPCKNSNITVFSIGANGILTAQQTYYTQGVNPFRLITDGSGYLYVLDHDSPASNSTNSDPVVATNSANCAAALGAGVTTCGDITAFKVNSTTGRLSLVVDAQVTSTQGSTLSYFPVPANPVDFVMTSSYVFTMSATTATASSSFPYTGGATVYPYAFTSTGQLTTTGISSPGTVLNIKAGTAIVSAGGYIWVLDNEAPTSNTTGAVSQILARTVGTSGALVAPSSGAFIADNEKQSNPIALVVENKGTWFYVANQGNGTDTSVALSGIAAYIINSPFNPAEQDGLSFGTGAGPVCMVEDPSYQFIYTANHDSATVVGQSINRKSGGLTPLSESTKASSSYALTGPPSWCLVNGRTD
jgi:6-phosphogluconolactonase (cycloisomerase 2 family)